MASIIFFLSPSTVAWTCEHGVCSQAVKFVHCVRTCYRDHFQYFVSGRDVYGMLKSPPWRRMYTYSLDIQEAVASWSNVWLLFRVASFASTLSRFSPFSFCYLAILVLLIRAPLNFLLNRHAPRWLTQAGTSFLILPDGCLRLSLLHFFYGGHRFLFSDWMFVNRATTRLAKL